MILQPYSPCELLYRLLDKPGQVGFIKDIAIVRGVRKPTLMWLGTYHLTGWWVVMFALQTSAWSRSEKGQKTVVQRDRNAGWIHKQWWFNGGSAQLNHENWGWLNEKPASGDPCVIHTGWWMGIPVKTPRNMEGESTKCSYMSGITP